ncbi:hypothetical protein EMIT0194MI4_80019 [Pseudomonas sp. IT-194MI4]
MSRIDRMSPSDGPKRIKVKRKIQCMEAIRISVLQSAIPSNCTSQKSSLNFPPRRIVL